jgi:UDP-N-acetylglucosamine acyltransferase
MAIHPTAMVDSSARLGRDVEIGPHSFIGPNVEIGDGCRIGHHVNIEQNTTLGAGTRIWPFVSLGSDAQDLKYQGEDTFLEIGQKVQIREFVTMNRGTGEGGGITRVGDNGLFLAYSHVAHDCQIGNQVIMSNSANLAGHVTIDDNAIISGLCAVHQFVRIGSYCFVGGMSGVAQDMPPYTLCEGNRAKTHGLNVVGLKRAGFTSEALEALKGAYRIIFRSRTPLKKALEEVRQTVPLLPEVEHLLQFVESSQRGVPR